MRINCKDGKSFEQSMTRGQSLFEVVMALSVISLIIFGIVILAVNSIRNSTFSRDKALATNYSQEADEWLRGQRDTGWSVFYGRAGNTYCLVSEPINSWGTIGTCSSFIGSTNFKREVSLISVDANTIRADIKVYWNDSQGYHEVTASTNFTNFQAK